MQLILKTSGLRLLTLILYVFFVHTGVSAQQLYLNEMMSSNQGFIFDEDGDSPDWIEIFNAADTAVNLGGYFLSDDVSDLQKWAFPDTVIESGRFMLVFASGKNISISGRELHTNFSIKSTGEQISIAYSGNMIHHFPEVNLETNTSYGHSLDGQLPCVVFTHPTPGFSNELSGITEHMVFSSPGGIYDENFFLNIENPAQGTKIYYTLNSDVPTNNSIEFIEPLMLGKQLFSQENICQYIITPPAYHQPPQTDNVPRAVVIRAAMFDIFGTRVSDVVTHTFFIRENDFEHSLPVVSICAQPQSLFDFETGIFVPGIHWDENNPLKTGNYFQTGKKWEREVSFEFYENEDKAFRQNAGLRISGNFSRRLSQKSLRLYARSLTNEAVFENCFFPDTTLINFKELVLRSFSSSVSQAGFEDFLCSKLAMQFNVDAVTSRPVVLYVNGEYWGIYFLQERVDENFVAARYGIDADSVQIVEDWQLGEVNNINNSFQILYDFISDNDMMNSANYQWVANQMDIDNFIDYHVFQVFIANTDWTVSNVKCWKENKVGSLWKWIFYDGDAALFHTGFDAFSHSLGSQRDEWSIDAKATLFFRKLFENHQFRQSFFQRLEFAITEVFNYQMSTYPTFNQIIQEIYREIPHQVNRFFYPQSFMLWNEMIGIIDIFLEKRACELRFQSRNFFDVLLGVEGCDHLIQFSPDVFLYPNPNAGSFSIAFQSNSASDAIVEIYNMNGILVYSGHHSIVSGNNKIDIQIPLAANGLYFLRINDSSAFGNSLFLIQR